MIEAGDQHLFSNDELAALLDLFSEQERALGIELAPETRSAALMDFLQQAADGDPAPQLYVRGKAPISENITYRK